MMGSRFLLTLARLSTRSVKSANLTRSLNRYSSTSSWAAQFTPNNGLALPPHGVEETDEEFDRRYEGYFNDQNIDGWMLRKRLTDLTSMDLIPEPKIVVAALKACRRVNDYALAVRYLEALYVKCGNSQNEIWSYVISEIKPTMDELGISTLEEMNYDKPELATESPFRY